MDILDENAVRRFIRMDELIAAMGPALADLSAKRAVQPVRVVVPVADHKGFFGVMPAYNGALGAKLVSFYPENVGVHTHHGLIALFKPETGEPLCIMDGRLITEMRTAAVSAVGVKYLSRRDATKLAIIGSGVQAGSHLEAIRLVRDISEVKVWSPRGSHRFAETHSVTVATSAESAVRDADIIVVVTSAKEPVLEGKWLSPGVHIAAIGANRPTWRELDDATLRLSKTYVESREAAMIESGDIISSGRIFAEIGEVIEGRADGRVLDDEITLFKTLGAAVEDIAAADLVYRRFLGR